MLKIFNPDRLIFHAYSLLVALAFVYAYQMVTTMSVPDGPLYAHAGLAGIIYALAGCFACIFPVVCVLGATEDSAYSFIWHLLSFHVGRLGMLLSYALCGEVFFTAIKSLYPVQLKTAGLIMGAFGIAILARKKIFSNIPARNSLFFIWGMAMGFGCSLEATPFLLPLWISPGTVWHKFSSYVLFSAAAVFVPLVVLVPFRMIRGDRGGFLKGVHGVLHESTGIFLVIVGILMIGGASR